MKITEFFFKKQKKRGQKLIAAQDEATHEFNNPEIVAHDRRAELAAWQSTDERKRAEQF
jgi:hypothetical protein